MKNPPLDFEHIAPLVANAEPRYTSLYVTFRCPETGVEVLSTARVGERTPIGGDVRQVGDFVRLRDALHTHNPPFLADGGPPKRGVEAVEELARQRPEADKLPPTVYHHAVVRAFEPVRSRFRWDAEKGRYVGVK
jgi:hypothetical protein